MSSKENISAKDIFNVFPLDFQNNTWVTFILCYEEDKIKHYAGRWTVLEGYKYKCH